MTLQVAIEVRSGGRGEDHAACFMDGERCIFALADGAGGVGGGVHAALTVLKAAEQFARRVHLSAADALAWADEQIALDGGLSTGVIVELQGDALNGASCGDSEAWLVDDSSLVELTAGQSRKPLLGAGGRLKRFGPVSFQGRLLMASDGITKYARMSEVLKRASTGCPAEAVLDIAELVRLPGGGYPDDLSIILALRA